jgi:hypothetical protein
MPGIDVKQDPPLEHREERGPHHATEVEKKIGAPDDLGQIRTRPSERLALLERLDVDASVGVTVVEQDGALSIHALRHQALEKLVDEPLVLLLVSARGCELNPKNIVAQCFQTQGILHEPDPVAAPC